MRRTEGEATGINEKNEISGTEYALEITGVYAGTTSRDARALGCAQDGLRRAEVQRARVSASTCAW